MYVFARRKPSWSLPVRHGFVWIHLRSYQKVKNTKSWELVCSIVKKLCLSPSLFHFAISHLCGSEWRALISIVTKVCVLWDDVSSSWLSQRESSFCLQRGEWNKSHMWCIHLALQAHVAFNCPTNVDLLKAKTNLRSQLRIRPKQGAKQWLAFFVISLDSRLFA